jgi:hypothetical protein
MKWQSVFLLALGIVVLSWLTCVATAPFNKKKELQQLVEADSLFAGSFKSIYDHPGMHQPVREKSYREALLELSENDSIQLVINLGDSTVLLSIRGVTIHRSGIEKFRKDKFLEKIPLIQEAWLFSRPLLVASHYATIVKEPVVVRHAPKDTLEAALNAWQPDTLIQHPAFVAFSAEHNIRIILEQDRNRRFDDYWTKWGFYTRMHFLKTIASLKNFLSLKQQEYQPTIAIKMPVDDLRAIYRALPHNTYVVIKL